MVVWNFVKNRTIENSSRNNFSSSFSFLSHGALSENFRGKDFSQYLQASPLQIAGKIYLTSWSKWVIEYGGQLSIPEA